MAKILTAIDKSDLANIKKLVNDKNVNIVIEDKSNTEEFTPLTYACSKGNVKVVNCLFDIGAKPDIKDKKSFTPLMKAAAANSIDVVNLLLEKGADVNKCGRYNQTAAFIAIESDHADILKHLASKKADLSVTDVDGGLVRQAMKYASTKCLDFLIEKKVDVNTVNKRDKDENVFFEAAHKYTNCDDGKDEEKKRRYQVLEKLHKGGADINFIAVRSNGKKESALHLATRCCDHSLIELLLKMKANINLQTDTGDTPLHCLFYRHPSQTDPFKRKKIAVETIELMLKNGANPNTPNKSRTTPFMYMMSTYLWLRSADKDTDILQLFLKHKADVKAKGFGGNSALHFAAKRCSAEICQLLIKNKAEIDVLNGAGETALHSSTQPSFALSSFRLKSYNSYKSNSVTYSLLKSGAKILKNEDGEYPHFLSTKNFVHDFHAMVEFGCDINAQAKNGNTILHVMAERGMDDLLKLIKENATGKTFDFTIKNEDGKSVTDIAKEEKWKEVEDFINKQNNVKSSKNSSEKEEKASKASKPAADTKAASTTKSTSTSKSDTAKKTTSSTKAVTSSKSTDKGSSASKASSNTKAASAEKTPKAPKPAGSSSSSSKTTSTKPTSKAKDTATSKEATKEKSNSSSTKTEDGKMKTGQQVMISYCHKQKETAVKISEYLKKNKINVWIDQEQMAGNILKKMAQAVCNSRVIIMCLSEEYETSPNCIREYEYAAVKNRPFIPVKVQNTFRQIEGQSLDIIMGMKMYYEVEEQSQFQENMPKILNEVKAILTNKVE